jgi:hypothetical protein
MFIVTLNVTLIFYANMYQRTIMTNKAVTKVVRFEIVKPVECDWFTFDQVLSHLSFNSIRMANFAMLKLWEWDNNSDQNKSPLNCYMLLRETFPDVGSSLTAQLERIVNKSYYKQRKKLLNFEISLPSFTSMPICVAASAWNAEKSEDGRGYIIKARLLSKSDTDRLSWYSFYVKSYFSPQKEILEALLSGEYKQGMIQIRKSKKTQKWFVSISYKCNPIKNLSLDLDKILTINFSSDRLLPVSYLTDHIKEKNIPVDDIAATIKTFKHRISQRLEAQRFFSSVNARNRKQTPHKPLSDLYEKLAAYKETKNHQLSRAIVNLSESLQCGTIKIINNGFFVEWDLTDLIKKIEYKSSEKGINLIVI